MQRPDHLDLLIHHARVFTADPAHPDAEAVGLVGDRLIFVGSDEDAASLASKARRVIDANQASLLPGLIDSHYHLLWGSVELGDARLDAARSPEHIIEILRVYAADHPSHEWIVGQGLNYFSIEGGGALTRQHLDAAVPDRPVMVVSYDGHTTWVNTEALKRGGLLYGGKAPPGSMIVMAPDGMASGELRESSAAPIQALIPPATDHRKRELLRLGLAQAAEVGLTSVHNMNGDLPEISLYAAMEDLGEMTLRIYVPFHAKPEMTPEHLAEAIAMRDQFQSPLVRGGAVKFFMDGVIESYTALMIDDYADDPGNVGMANFTAEHFNEMATAADKLGLQIFVHAIGDGAVRRVLDGYEAAQHANGVRDSRHRIEHIEVVHPLDVPRFAQLGVIASMQPQHTPANADGTDVWTARVGPSRWPHSYLWQTLRETGARLVFGSDWSVVSQNPLKGIHAAVNRHPWRDGLPDQHQTLSNALLGYTHDAAYAEFQENEKGQIKPGMLADLTLLAEDLFAVPPDKIDQVKVAMTITGGRIVYEA
jgi:predicted amidohydrolase YtcJ